MRDVLSDIVAIRINELYRSGSDTGRLGNVVLESTCDVKEMQLAEWQADPSKEAPISDDFLFFVGDRDPIKTCAGIIENTTTGRRSKICPLPGVFHESMGILQEAKLTQRGIGLILDRSILCEGR